MERKDWIFLALAVALSILILTRDYDSTDGANERSGMQLYIDHGTGCHYLRAGLFSPLVPRLTATGEHACPGQLWEPID